MSLSENDTVSSEIDSLKYLMRSTKVGTSARAQQHLTEVATRVRTVRLSSPCHGGGNTSDPIISNTSPPQQLCVPAVLVESIDGPPLLRDVLLHLLQ
jgi:hypothetical protein